jgi:hypothetical protein
MAFSIRVCFPLEDDLVCSLGRSEVIRDSLKIIYIANGFESLIGSFDRHAD